MQYMGRRRVLTVRLRAGLIKRAVDVDQACFHLIMRWKGRAAGSIGMPDEAKSQEATELPEAVSAFEMNNIFEETHDQTLSQKRLTCCCS
jgi:hypothetical protein